MVYAEIICPHCGYRTAGALRYPHVDLRRYKYCLPDDPLHHRSPHKSYRDELTDAGWSDGLAGVYTPIEGEPGLYDAWWDAGQFEAYDGF